MSEDQPVPTEPQPTGPEQPALPPRQVLLLAVVAVAAYAIDQVTKAIATAQLEFSEPVPILGGTVYLQLLRNSGAAFGMASGMTWLLALIAAAVVVALIWFARRLRSPGWAVGLGLILAGALGNLTDRIFRAPGVLQGHVVDFISVIEPNGSFFPVFNGADSALSIGCVLIVLLSLLGKDYDGTSTKKPKKTETSEKAAE